MCSSDLSRGLFSSVSIEQVEVYKGFPALKKRLLSEKIGCASLRADSDSTWVRLQCALTLRMLWPDTLFT